MVHRESRKGNSASNYSLNSAVKHTGMKRSKEQLHISKYLVLKSTTIKFKIRSVYDFGALQDYLGHIVLAITTIFSTVTDGEV